MANNINGRTWVLDTAAGFVTNGPVHIKAVAVTWKVASAGELVLDEVGPNDHTAGNRIITAKSTGATSAATNELTQVIPIDRSYTGLRKTTMTDIGGLEIITA